MQAQLQLPLRQRGGEATTSRYQQHHLRAEAHEYLVCNSSSEFLNIASVILVTEEVRIHF